MPFVDLILLTTQGDDETRIHLMTLLVFLT